MNGCARRWLVAAAVAAMSLPALHAVAAETSTDRAGPVQAAVPESSLSIYQYIQRHRNPRTGRMDPDAMTLPDEPATRSFSRLRWVPGALEGLGTRHIQWDGSAKAAQAIGLLEQIAEGNKSAEAALYDLLRADDVVTFYNDALDFASARIPDAEPVLHDFARRLATQSHDRGPVKFGIAMLGSMGDEKDLDIVRTLALHDEFGLYAAEAIGELAPQRQQALFEMAQKLSGWGRIEAVTLMTATADPTLRRWLLTEAFRNDVTPQYLAYHCARIGDLADAMSEEANLKDMSFLAGVSDLIQSLTRPGPSRDSQTYQQIPEVAIAYLQNVQGRRDSIAFFLTAQVLNEYADGAPWTADQKASVKKLAAPILADRSWRRRITAELSDDRADLEQAEVAARKLGIDTFDVHLRRLEKNGAEPMRWRLAFSVVDPHQLRSLVDVAERTFAPRFAPRAAGRANTSDAALEAVLQGVGKFPGSGVSIVDASLLDGSPAVRRTAVDTLVRWGGPYLRDMTVRKALSAAANGETDAALKARMVALLTAGEAPP